MNTAETFGIILKETDWTTETFVNVCVCVNIMFASMYDRRERECVCVLARRAASSGGRGLWFVVDYLYAPPTRC